MRKAKVYFLNGLTVSFVGLVLRFAAMAYTVYVSGKLGAEGMGLLSLVSSVHTLALTLASSGVNLTCTRLCADALALENYRETRRSLKGCILYSLFFGLSRKFRVKGSANGGLFAGAVPGASGIRPDRLLLRLHERLPTGLQGVLGFDF